MCSEVNKTSPFLFFFILLARLSSSVLSQQPTGVDGFGDRMVTVVKRSRPRLCKLADTAGARLLRLLQNSVLNLWPVVKI